MKKQQTEKNGSGLFLPADFLQNINGFLKKFG
jgi:hypothetical protein